MWTFPTMVLQSQYFSITVQLESMKVLIEMITGSFEWSRTSNSLAYNEIDTNAFSAAVLALTELITSPNQQVVALALSGLMIFAGESFLLSF